MKGTPGRLIRRMAGAIVVTLSLPSLALVSTPAAAAPAAEGQGSQAGATQQLSELDAFMEQVLGKRVRNWEDLYRYTVRDTEAIEIRGPGDMPIESFHADYVWYVRDGVMVRSPQEINGVKVGDEQREKAEQRFIERAREAQEKRNKKAEDDDGSGESMERETFLGFPFEPGNYLLAGRETLDGREVLRVEYYPVKLFDEDDEDEEDPEEQEFTRAFQKTSRVTMWILPDQHQIVRITFENVGLEFLPMRWLVQIDDVSATLNMEWLEAEQVWLPASIRAHGQASVATGTFEVSYSLDYHDYKKSDVEATVRYRLPGEQAPDRDRDPERQPEARPEGGR